ncbi:MAG: hypothetical protein R3B09_32870 [Nannocystaceae bacterium]
MGILIGLLSVLAIGFYAVISRVLAHRERMAEIEARRPKVVLQLPAVTDDAQDDLTERILAAAAEKGIDLDLEHKG